MSQTTSSSLHSGHFTVPLALVHDRMTSETWGDSEAGCLFLYSGYMPSLAIFTFCSRSSVHWHFVCSGVSVAPLFISRSCHLFSDTLFLSHPCGFFFLLSVSCLFLSFTWCIRVVHVFQNPLSLSVCFSLSAFLTVIQQHPPSLGWLIQCWVDLWLSHCSPPLSSFYCPHCVMSSNGTMCVYLFF